MSILLITFKSLVLGCYKVHIINNKEVKMFRRFIETIKFLLKLYSHTFRAKDVNLKITQMLSIQDNSG